MTNNKRTEEESNKDFNFLVSLSKMSKKDLRHKVLEQKDEIKELKQELESIKFVLKDASEDLISISKAQYLINEQRKDVQYVNKCIANGEPYV